MGQLAGGRQWWRRYGGRREGQKTQIGSAARHSREGAVLRWEMQRQWRRRRQQSLQPVRRLKQHAKRQTGDNADNGKVAMEVSSKTPTMTRLCGSYGCSSGGDTANCAAFTTGEPVPTE